MLKWLFRHIQHKGESITVTVHQQAKRGMDNKQNKIIQFFEQIQNRMVTHISFRVGALKCPTGEYITTYI